MKAIKRTIIFLSLLICFGFLRTNNVNAANGMVKLKPDKTYKDYDVTGKGKKDKIRIQREKKLDYCYMALSITVNGKKQQLSPSKYMNYYYGVDARLFTLKNGKKYLFLYADGENGDSFVCGFYQYTSGQWKKVADLATVFKGYGSHLCAKAVSVKGNRIKVQFYVMSWATGPSTIEFTYVSKGGNLKRESSYGTYKSIYSYGKNTRTFYAAKKLPVFQNSNGTKQVFTVKKGGKVKILKCRLTGGKMYIQIKYGNRKGWIKASTNYNSRLFTNVTYAG